jgi:predicted RNA methylase
MLAARAGASRVYACESVAAIAEKAKDIIALNRLSDHIVVINKRSSDLVIGIDLPERVDVLLSEIVDHVIIGEGIIPTLEHALVHLAKPTSKIIPDSGHLLISAFQCDELHSRYCLSEAAGFDISPFNQFSICGASTLLQLSEFALTPLSEPTPAFEFCFSKSHLCTRD